MDTSVIDQAKLESFVMRAIGDLSAGYGGVMVSLGSKLGLYKAMAYAGPISPKELAARTGCAERYVREWLNAQAAGGYVAYHAASGAYELSPEQAMVLADEDSPVYIPNAWNVPASMWFDEDKAIEAFRTGKGVAWGDHHGRLYCGVAAFYRNAYKGSLLSSWLPALEGVTERLDAGIAVADVGCGHGHSTMLMAQAYPGSRFHGFDTHADSVQEARQNAADAGCLQQVHFDVARAVDYPGRDYGLICFFDCLHDLGDPVGALAHARAHLAEDGWFFVVKPNAPDRLEDNLNPLGLIWYASGHNLCVPNAVSQGGSALGNQAGPKKTLEAFMEGGFPDARKVTESVFNMVIAART